MSIQTEKAELHAEAYRRREIMKDRIRSAINEGRIPGTVKDYTVSCRVITHRRVADKVGLMRVRSKLIPEFVLGESDPDEYFEQWLPDIEAVANAIGIDGCVVEGAGKRGTA